MDQNVDPTAAAAAASASEPVAPAAPAAPQYDPAYVAQLEDAYNRLHAESQRLAPVREDVEWMLADEGRRTGIKRYRESWEQASKPQIHPELQPIFDEFDRRFKPMEERFTREDQQRQQQQTAAQQTFERDNMAYLNRLAATEKLSRDVQVEIVAYADSLATRLQRNVTVEEAWKKLSSRRTSNAPDAPSLRSDAGAIGVPGPSTTNNDRWKTDFHGSLVDTLKKAQRSA